MQRRWPYDAMISQDGTDFQLITLDNATKIRNWNAKWAYPRLICATMDMFFDAIMAQADPAKIKSFAKDGNNQWADQDSAAARVLAEARKRVRRFPRRRSSPRSPRCWPAANILGPTSTRPTIACSSITSTPTGPDNAFDGSRENTQRIETEQAEMREMVDDAKYFSDRARQNALDRLAGLIRRRPSKR